MSFNDNKTLDELMKTEYTYPLPNKDDFQNQIYQKREFYYHKMPSRSEKKNYEEIKEYRDSICARKFSLLEHQSFLSNFINPDTPYKGCLVFHGTGTGKCVLPDQKIYINNNLMRIDDIWKKYKSDCILIDDNKGEWYNLNNNIYTNSLDYDSNIIKTKISKLYREKVKTKIKKIILENGNTISCTLSHKFYEKSKKWTNNINNGDMLAIPKILKRCNKVFKVTLELAEFLGWQISKGIENNNKLLISTDNNIYDRLEYLFKKICEQYNLKNSKISYDKNNFKLESKDYVDMLIENGYIWESYNNTIPDIIMKSDKEKQYAFISSYINNLSIINDDESIDIICKSNSIGLQFFHFLKILGLDSKIRNIFYNFEKNYNLINISGYYLQKLLRNIKILNNKLLNIKIDNYDIKDSSNDNSEIQYVKVNNVIYDYYDGYVYDMEIIKYHNYICQGIITHNTCAAIAIGERFKDMVQKYNTKIHVLVSGPLIRESWKEQLLKCTGETYLKYVDNSIYMDTAEKNKMRKIAINKALQYYKFMSYRSFYKKVLGEKIIERTTSDTNKVKVSYRKTEEGEFERDVAVDRIYDLNNSIIIVDEAHGLTGNAYGEALMKIIKASSNLKVVLLTATPMKNLADDIVELLNFIRPQTSPIVREKIFTSDKNHLMDFRPGGIEYLKNMARGYVSYLRGADPLTFAKKIEKGERPEGLLFTKVVKCKMNKFQRKTYDMAREEEDDSLDRKSEAVANFSIPGLSNDKKKIVGLYGRHGINTVKNQLKTYYDTINNKISTEILKDNNIESESDLLYFSENDKTITGSIFKLNNLKHFSIKFYKTLKKINELYYGMKGPRTAFIYSNLVKVGIELFTEVLLQNGYLEYQENPNNYTISSNTKCYFCGKTFKEHQTDKLKINIERNNDKSSEHVLKKDIPEHNFYPATFMSITGSSSEEGVGIDIIPEDKTKILRDVFNNIDNKDGRYIKFVLGSKVMNEGISLMNVAEVHILDVYFNLGKVDQVIGRAIRHCSHYKMMNKNNPFPIVDVYKYAVTLDDKELSSEEELYKKAELKYLLVKKVERALKQVAIDCPLNRNGNIFPEEIKLHTSCCPLNKEEYSDTPLVKKYSHCLNKNVDQLCPSICDFMRCEFKCEDSILNNKYYDPERKLYTKISKKDLDVTTFTNSLARNEIENTKKKIKEMYKFKYAYTLNNIIEYVKNTYKGEKRNLFDEFFIYKALDELLPIKENDFNNFRDTILDKFNRQGYLIYIDKYYIYQPFDQNENVPMHYRTTISGPLINRVTLYNYLKNKKDFSVVNNQTSDTLNENILKESSSYYDFDSVMEYYDNRDEYKYIGIIDKEASRRKTKHPDDLNDVFKIREKREKILEKKRGTGIPSLKGAVCSTSKSKDYLIEIAKDLKLKLKSNEIRTTMCTKIKNELLHREKYQTGNKITYIMIPANHDKYQFPYNLEDRIEYRKKQIKEKINGNIDISVKMKKKDNKISYKIIIKNNSKIEKESEFLASLGGILYNNVWTINIE